MFKMFEKSVLFNWSDIIWDANERRRYLWLTCSLYLLVINVLVAAGSSLDQPIQTIPLQGRVLLLYNQPIDVDEVLAIQLHLVRDTPCLVQIWRQESPWTYSLVWQQEVPIIRTLSYEDRINHTLNVHTPFGPIESHHRLGMYTIEGQASLPIVITDEEERRAIVSPSPDPLPPVMTTHHTTITFDAVPFPYTVPRDCLRLCSELDCGLNIIRSSTGQPTPQMRVGPTASASTGEEHFLLSIPFLTGLLVWLIILTFMLLSVICLIVCLFFKRKDKTEAAHTPSDERDPGEWYVVMDDPPCSLTFDTSKKNPGTSSARPGHMTINDSHLAFENNYSEENI